MRRFMVVIPFVLMSCSTQSAALESPDHDFVAHALARPAVSEVRGEAGRRPDLDPLLAASRERFSRGQELTGLLDVAAQRALAETPWLEHPALMSKRSGVRAALAEYGQARELEDLLIASRSLRRLSKPGAPVVSPHVESLRGRMADLSAESAWQDLRGELVARACGLFDAQAALILRRAQVSTTVNHLSLIDELIPVIRARISTGTSRQADLLSIRSEQSSVTARLESLRALKHAAVATIREAANATAAIEIKIPPLEGKLPSAAELVKLARAHQPALLAIRADLERRRTALRLADLVAFDVAGKATGGVRAAVRGQMRERIEMLERRLAADEQSLSAQVARARARLVGARAQELALRNQSLPDARQALEDLRSSYAGRRAGFLEVFRAARRRLDVELNLARMVSDRTQAETALFRILGRRTL